MSRYAARTKVPISNSRNELERTLTRYGATGFAYGSQIVGPHSKLKVSVGFQAHKRTLRITMLMEGNDTDRQRWRALLLVVKAKLEAVESGITTFDDEFMPWVVLPSGETLAEWARPQLERLIAGGKMPPLLPGPRE